MPDVYSTMMREHLADCFQACGLSPTGAVEVANEQPASRPADQAMMEAFKPVPYENLKPVQSTNGDWIHPTQSSKPYSPVFGPSMMNKKTNPPPGLQTAPSQMEVVSLG